MNLLISKIRKAAGPVLSVLLFLYTVNFQGRFQQSGLLLLLIACCITLQRCRVRRSWQSAFVILFLFVYGVITSIGMGENTFEKILQFAGLYLMGCNVCEMYMGKNDRDGLFRTIFWAAAGFGTYGILCTFGMGGVFSATQRIKDFWAPTDVVASTQVSAWIVTFLAVVPWVVLRFKKVPVLRRIAAVCLTVLAVISIFFLASRTSLLVVLLAVILTLYCLMKGRQRKTLSAIVFLLFLAFLAFQMNVGGIQDKLLSSNLVLRLIAKSGTGGAFQTSRTTIWLYVATHWDECLTGGYYFSSKINVQLHSALLDMYDQAGLIPFLLLALIIMRAVQTLVRLRKRDPDREFARGFLIWFLLISMVFFTEPVWYYGRAHYVAFVFFMLGVLEHYWLQIKRKGSIDLHGHK